MTPRILRMKCDTLCPPGLCHCSPTTVSSHQSFGHTGLNHTGIPWLTCTLSRPHAFVPRASWPGTPSSPACPNGRSPEPAQTPVLWEGGSPGSVIRTQDDTLRVPTAPCLCCSWTETQPKVPASRAACPSRRIPQAIRVRNTTVHWLPEAPLWCPPDVPPISTVCGASFVRPCAPRMLGSRSLHSWVPSTWLGSEQVQRDYLVSDEPERIYLLVAHFQFKTHTRLIFETDFY